MRLIEFACKPAKPDPELKQKLRAEAPGILRWMVAGAARFYEKGLGDVPESIVTATREYQTQEDQVRRFLNDRLVCGTEHQSARRPRYIKATCHGSEIGGKASRCPKRR